MNPEISLSQDTIFIGVHTSIDSHNEPFFLLCRPQTMPDISSITDGENGYRHPIRLDNSL